MYKIGCIAHFYLLKTKAATRPGAKSRMPCEDNTRNTGRMTALLFPLSMSQLALCITQPYYMIIHDLSSKKNPAGMEETNDPAGNQKKEGRMKPRYQYSIAWMT